ncbi:hypothetical protein DVR12_20680 [Chitinophaga silvatica]|uniref:Uncharacterized protein n=1 Tax=Chitinophaga silvatica TaxID=2282649 RepID=A0A3E1Y5W8_9BACT|nr:hypothetical protein [Chitinophaga silvatica]RFS20134.1 hypothetical protein DVR12_20680 [Chitinophaga silvatica]
MILFSSRLYAQEDTVTSRLLREIAAEQYQSDSFYYAGMFASHRYYGYPDGKRKHDNNVFFTGLIAMTLGEIQNELRGPDSILCLKIRKLAQQSFPHFQHKSGRQTYNFWRTNPSMVFPNSWFLNLFRKWHSLPDDIDDTSILLLAMEADSTTALAAKELMEQHANTVNYGIKNTFKKYRGIPAYSTWFGKNMPIDFDACVLSNTLYFMHTYNMANSKADNATVQLLDAFIRHREYLSDPAYISPHYARSPVLIYHFARLIGKYPDAVLIQHREQLAKDAQMLLKESRDEMDKIILSTSLMWLGEEAPVIDIKKIDVNGDFVFFVAGFNSLLPDPYKKFFSGYHLISYYYRCPTYNKVLMLQNHLLRKRLASTKQ